MEKIILKIADDAVVGLINPLKAYVELKRIEKALKLAIESVQESATSEAAKYGQKLFEDYGAKIEMTELGTKYDFEQCGDVAWQQWDASVRSASESKKDRETFLKALRSPIEVVDTTTGETHTISPPFKSSKSGIKITLK